MDNNRLSPEDRTNAPFEEVVRQRYLAFMPKFVNILCKKYSFLSHAEAMDIYTNVYLAVHNNLEKGRVRPDTNWEAYMLTIGERLVQKNYRSGRKLILISFDELFGEDDRATERRVDKLLAEVQAMAEEEDSPYEDPELIDVLNAALAELPEKCAAILRYFYYDNMNMDNIATLLGYNAAVTVRNRKRQCLVKLAEKVKASAARLGYDL